MVKALVFDVGDTLLPAWRLCRETLREMKAKGVPQKLLSAYYREATNDGRPHTWTMHGDPVVMERALRKTRYTYDPKKLCAKMQKIYWRKAREYYKKNRATVDKIRELHKKYKTGVLSNNSRLGARLFMKTAPFRIDAAMFSVDAGVEKPDKKMFMGIAKKLGVSTGEIIYFGNDLKRDAAAARCGMHFVYVYGFSRRRPYSGQRISKITPSALAKVVGYFEQSK